MGAPAQFSRHLSRHLSRHIDLYVLAPIITLWVLIRIPTPKRLLNDSDIGCQVAGAQQIAFGEHPFVDWHSTYGPLTYYASYVFRVLSGNLIGSEVALCTIGFLLSYLVLYSLVKRHSKNKVAPLLVLAVALVHMPAFYKYYAVLAPLCFLLAAFRYLERPNLIRLLWVSASIALAGLYRSDFGAYTFIAGVVTACLARTPDWRVTAKNCITLSAGVLLFAAPWLCFVIYHGQLQTYLWDSSFGAVAIADGLSRPIPTINSYEPWTSRNNRVSITYPFWLMIPVISAMLLRLKWKHLEPIYRKEMVVTLVLSGLCLLQATHRSSYNHLIQAIPCCFVLLGFLFQSVVARSPSKPALAARNRLVLVAGSILLAISASVSFTPIIRSLENLGKKIDSAGMYFLLPPEFIDQAAIRYKKSIIPPMVRVIQKYTKPGEAILAVPYRTTLYPLSQRRFGGGQMLMAPGYFSSHREQRNLIEIMKEQDNPMIIELTGGGGFDQVEERRTRVFASLFYEHIDSNYKVVSDPDIPIGYTLWMHTDKMPPQP
jgi:hypothetical protein